MATLTIPISRFIPSDSGFRGKAWKFADDQYKPSLPPSPTRFEAKVSELGLSEGQLIDSPELCRWATANACRYYVPEELLMAWGITVDEYLSREADLAGKGMQ